MIAPTQAYSPSEPDPVLTDRLRMLGRVWLLLAAALAFVALLVRWMPPAGNFLSASWPHMEPLTALMTLISAAALQLSEERYSRGLHRASQLAGAAVSGLAADQLAIYLTRGAHSFAGLFALHPGRPAPWPQALPPLPAACFVLLGLTILLVQARGFVLVLLADLLTFALGFLTLVLVAGYVFSALPFFGALSPVPASSSGVICLALLAQVALFRRAECGIFTILTGRGVGSRLGRYMVPILLMAQFLREGLRAHLLSARSMAPHYLAAFLSSTAAATVIVIILFLSWRINRMERQIQGLSLRDALTGLYNLRGFRLLAEQALRLALRSGEPFSVLFVDLDDLKLINDTLGHHTGSQFLVETAELLTATFRETDVIGRIGGDEFAVAGQFSEAEIVTAMGRLEAAARERNHMASAYADLHFSAGHVTHMSAQHISLNQLLALADEAMYQQKRNKKPQSPARLQRA